MVGGSARRDLEGPRGRIGCVIIEENWGVERADGDIVNLRVIDLSAKPRRGRIRRTRAVALVFHE